MVTEDRALVRSQRSEVRGRKDKRQRSEIKRLRIKALFCRWYTAEEPGGVSRINAGDGNILGNDCPSSDHNLIADCYRENSSICADAYTIAKLGWAPKLWLSSRPACDKQIVDEHRAVRNEAILPDCNQLADERVGLNATPLANDRPFLYLHKWPNEAAISNRAAIQIDRLHHRDVFTERYIDNPCVTDFWLCHKGLA
jgi:hypothetical protein